MLSNYDFISYFGLHSIYHYCTGDICFYIIWLLRSSIKCYIQNVGMALGPNFELTPLPLFRKVSWHACHYKQMLFDLNLLEQCSCIFRTFFCTLPPIPIVGKLYMATLCNWGRPWVRQKQPQSFNPAGKYYWHSHLRNSFLWTYLLSHISMACAVFIA